MNILGYSLSESISYTITLGTNNGQIFYPSEEKILKYFSAQII